MIICHESHIHIYNYKYINMCTHIYLFIYIYCIYHVIYNIIYSPISSFPGYSEFQDMVPHSEPGMVQVDPHHRSYQGEERHRLGQQGHGHHGNHGINMELTWD